MKKFSLIILLGLLAVGCSGTKVEESVKQIHYTGVDNMNYYDKNIELSLACRQLKEEIESYPENEEDCSVGIQFHDAEEGEEFLKICMNYSFLAIDKRGKLLIDNPIMQKIEKEFMPGVNTFIQTVCEEKENLEPQAIVINNNWMIMCPIHLYTAAYSIIGTAVTIGLNDFKIKDDYFKKLIGAVDTKKFVVHEPLIVDDGAVLQFSTPFYLYDVEVRNETKNEERSLQGGPNMSFRLYIYQGKIKEIHTIIKPSDGSKLRAEDLESILTWAKEDWQADEETLSSLQELIDSIASGTLTKQKGRAGNCQYTYDVQERKYNRGKIIEMTLKPND